jgi:hypothetical protein
MTAISHRHTINGGAAPLQYALTGRVYTLMDCSKGLVPVYLLETDVQIVLLLP